VNVSLYQAASALNANSRWQEMISENLASSSIPGFKKRLMPTTAGFPQHFTLARADVATNFRPGEIQSTSSKTDVALEGPGFFAVQMPNGTTGYTRDGEFQINALGELTTKQGYTVLGEAGPIRLNLSDTSSPLNISPSGEVSQGTELRGKFRVVDFQQPQLLTPVGGGFFIAQNPNLMPTPITQPSIRQGCLEAANSSSVSEMANLISAMRGFEANQRVIQLHDDRMGRAISDLGNPS
jgi:flagellar basal body rod protein FlgG